jgi:hypothetical protein
MRLNKVSLRCYQLSNKLSGRQIVLVQKNFLDTKFVKYEDLYDLHPESVADLRNNDFYTSKFTLVAHFIITSTGACFSPTILMTVLTLHDAYSNNNFKEVIRFK